MIRNVHVGHSLVNMAVIIMEDKKYKGKEQPIKTDVS